MSRTSPCTTGLSADSTGGGAFSSNVWPGPKLSLKSVPVQTAGEERSMASPLMGTRQRRRVWMQHVHVQGYQLGFFPIAPGLAVNDEQHVQLFTVMLPAYEQQNFGETGSHSDHRRIPTTLSAAWRDLSTTAPRMHARSECGWASGLLAIHHMHLKGFAAQIFLAVGRKHSTNVDGFVCKCRRLHAMMKCTLPTAICQA